MFNLDPHVVPVGEETLLHRLYRLGWIPHSVWGSRVFASRFAGELRSTMQEKVERGPGRREAARHSASGAVRPQWRRGPTFSSTARICADMACICTFSDSTVRSMLVHHAKRKSSFSSLVIVAHCLPAAGAAIAASHMLPAAARRHDQTAIPRSCKCRDANLSRNSRTTPRRRCS